MGTGMHDLQAQGPRPQALFVSLTLAVSGPCLGLQLLYNSRTRASLAHRWCAAFRFIGNHAVPLTHYCSRSNADAEKRFHGWGTLPGSCCEYVAGTGQAKL